MGMIKKRFMVTDYGRKIQNWIIFSEEDIPGVLHVVEQRTMDSEVFKTDGKVNSIS